MTPVLFPGDQSLEGIYEKPSGIIHGGVVVAHPHPLYGGTMAQPVVYRVAKACRQRGLATLRFNFRGVGRSAGAYSGLDEYRDVEAALAYLRTQLRGEDLTSNGVGVPLPLGLAGYSFGSIMAGMAAAGDVRVSALALIAFVAGWEEMPSNALSRLATFRGPVLAVCGDVDEQAPPGVVERVLSSLGLNFSLKVIRGSGHFFEGNHALVGRLVADFITETFARGQA